MRDVTGQVAVLEAERVCREIVHRLRQFDDMPARTRAERAQEINDLQNDLSAAAERYRLLTTEQAA